MLERRGRSSDRPDSPLGIHTKPCGLLNVANYYSSLLALAEHAVAEGFVRATHQQAIVVEEDPERLLDRLNEVGTLTEHKWTRRSDTPHGGV